MTKPKWNDRKSDELLLIQFVYEQAMYEQLPNRAELVNAAHRLMRCIDKDLMDYSSPDCTKDGTKGEDDE